MLAAVWWNNGAGAPLPPWRRLLRRSRRAAGCWCSGIRGSVELFCSKGGLRGGGDDRLVEVLSLVPVFALVRLLLALSWGYWGLVGGVLAAAAVWLHRLYRSGAALLRLLWPAVGARGVVVADAGVFCSWWPCSLLSPAGRGGEGRRGGTRRGGEDGDACCGWVAEGGGSGCLAMEVASSTDPAVFKLGGFLRSMLFI